MRWPAWLQALKYRLFFTFLLFILLPLFLLNLYLFQQAQYALQDKVGEQSREQLLRMDRQLADLLNIAFRTFSLMEQDSTLTDVLRRPGEYDTLERKRKVEEKFKAINNSLFITNPQVYYTVADHKGNIYTSFQPAQTLHGKAVFEEEWYRRAVDSLSPYRWQLSENYIHPDETRSAGLLTVVSPFKDDLSGVYAAVRISFDYSYWFRTMTEGERVTGQDYILVSDEGRVLASTNKEEALPSRSIQAILDKKLLTGDLKDETYLYNYSYMPAVRLWLVKRVPLDILFGQIHDLKTSLLWIFVAATCLFSLVTWFVANKVTRPLKLLQVKMGEMSRKKLKIKLPEPTYGGEVLELTRTFNQMVVDMNELIDKLKLEERRKETIHFRMLLSQTNPHFLLNTLNTIKWIAFGKQVAEIEDICVSLGKLLEAGLNSEQELIYLKDELALVEAYLTIQRYRFRSNLQVEIDYDSKLQYALLPKLSLQPLVENAIIHGIAGMMSAGKIQVRIRQEQDQMLSVEVQDNGVGLSKALAKKTVRQRGSIGISNIRERLELLFKDRCGLDIRELEQGTLVRFTLPLLLSTPYQKEDSHVEGPVGGG